jgi:hypothetical protein
MKLVTNKFESGGLHEKHVVRSCQLLENSAPCTSEGTEYRNVTTSGMYIYLPLWVGHLKAVTPTYVNAMRVAFLGEAVRVLFVYLVA